MRCLVTGGAGFIGSAIARALVARGDEAVVVDNLVTGYKANLPASAEFLEVDLASPSSVSRLPRSGIDAVLHLAAQSSGEISHEDPSYDLMTNTLGTLSLLRWCEEFGVDRFLYASSMSVYGSVEDAPVKEDAACAPLSFYGVTKLASENYIRLFSARNVKSTVFRMFNVYGPGQNLANMKQGMVSIYLAYLLRGEPIHVRGARERFRDFIFIDDVIAAWLQALQSPRSHGRVYNLASGQKVRVWELIEAMLRVSGSDREYPVEYSGSTPGDQHGIYGDVERAKSELGWTPTVDLDDGLSRMMAWARESTSRGEAGSRPVAASSTHR